ncbi:transcriptional regulator [Chryseobacterium indologenes]|uniref:winged helix-turn-helix domain-containing protein n=1 Tax=Chryseobacterium indologenes TaxID=253 RepID=UPI0003E0808A|nr:transcriptional regulator [Chryseobacterium indologenes]QPQ51189.1 transcriptional regulator [Chryseobacterium indologenes]GAE66773.1 hypothetical protein CIN01S_18_01000 [Chryseobacterium indologenes NBRC 14944]SFK01241.1 DNA-binding transcriptional regulator, MarR family [Chryseobacterium indologenes]SUX49576.1 Uncharacterised protein [Chryseobacterium indologenes]
MFKDLNPILHSQLRLAIISILASVEEAEFVYLREKTGATSGNLSLQLDKLRKNGYIEIKKGFKNNYPLTTCQITEEGMEALKEYTQNIKNYLNL